MTTLFKMPDYTVKIFGLLSVIFAVSCGGGTSGTGLNAYEGTVTDQKGAPLEGVSLTVESTGDSAKTDRNGNFELQSSASGQEVALLAESSTRSSRVTVRNVFAEDSRVQISVVLGSHPQDSSATHLNVRSRMVGYCDYYFENRTTIRQANHVPGDTVCTLKTEVLEDGLPLDGALVALEYAGCAESSPWSLLAVGETNSVETPGSAKISFTYIDSPTYCRYRVIAPYKSNGEKPVYYPIQTFTKQEYDQAAKK